MRVVVDDPDPGPDGVQLQVGEPDVAEPNGPVQRVDEPDQGGGQGYAAPDDYSSQDVASSDDLGGGDDDFA